MFLYTVPTTWLCCSAYALPDCILHPSTCVGLSLSTPTKQFAPHMQSATSVLSGVVDNWFYRSGIQCLFLGCCDQFFSVVFYTSTFQPLVDFPMFATSSHLSMVHPVQNLVLPWHFLINTRTWSFYCDATWKEIYIRQKDFFTRHIINLWNSLSQDMLTATNVYGFNKELNKFMVHKGSQS